MQAGRRFHAFLSSLVLKRRPTYSRGEFVVVRKADRPVTFFKRLVSLVPSGISFSNDEFPVRLHHDWNKANTSPHLARPLGSTISHSPNQAPNASAPASTSAFNANPA